MSTLERVTAMATRHFGGKGRAIDPDVPFEQLGADSLGYLEFLFELEEEFAIAIEQDAAKQVHTLRELSDLVDRLGAAHPPPAA